jgi:hypothetical protein
MRLNIFAEKLLRQSGVLVSYETDDGGDGILTPEFSASVILNASVIGLQLLFPIMGHPFSATLSTLHVGKSGPRKTIYVDLKDEQISNVSTRYAVIASLIFLVDALKNQLGQKSVITLEDGQDRNAILIQASDLRDPALVQSAIFDHLTEQDKPIPKTVEITISDAESLSDMFTQSMRRR